MVQQRDPEPSALLMAAVQQGDTGAFADLYDQLSPLVFGIAVRTIRDPARAQEVAQEVFVELWRHASRFDASNGSIRSWASTIAHRRAVDCVRSVQSTRERETKALVDPTSVFAELAGIDHGPDAAGVAGEVQRALEALTPSQREAIERAYFGARTYAQVAADLGVPEGTVKSRIRDGLLRMRADIDADRAINCSR